MQKAKGIMVEGPSISFRRIGDSAGVEIILPVDFTCSSKFGEDGEIKEGRDPACCIDSSKFLIDTSRSHSPKFLPDASRCQPKAKGFRFSRARRSKQEFQRCYSVNPDPYPYSGRARSSLCSLGPLKLHGFLYQVADVWGLA